MKKTQILFSMLLLGVLTLSSFTRHEPSWKEMEDFHAVMSATFHSSEEDNLQPLKEKAGDLLAKAIAWQKATVPQGYNGELTKPILKRLVQQCKKIKQAVQKKSDAELIKMITEAHEIFHEIKEKCVEK